MHPRTRVLHGARSTGRVPRWRRPARCTVHGPPCRRARSHVSRCTVERGFEPCGTVHRARRSSPTVHRAPWNVARVLRRGATCTVHRARPPPRIAHHGGPCTVHDRVPPAPAPCTVQQGSKPRSTVHRGTWGNPWPHGAPCTVHRAGLRHLRACPVDRAPCTAHVRGCTQSQPRWTVRTHPRPRCTFHGAPCDSAPLNTT